MPGRSPLAAQLFASSTPLEPLPTDLETSFAPISDLRAVVFDVYGTLFISASGDLDRSSTAQHEKAFRTLLQQRGVNIPKEKNLTQTFTAAIHAEHRRAQTSDIEFPEIEIREIWCQVLSDPDLSASEIEEIAIAWETLTNPVWPMPDLAETLKALRNAGLLLGLVSNAQFFTPLLFEAFLEESPHDLGFHPSLCHWSYLERQAKPGPHLFQRLTDSLPALNLKPSQILYVGNDMRNDIIPAAATGFHTVLFAGDRRSLRLRGHSPPERVIIRLADLVSS